MRRYLMTLATLLALALASPASAIVFVDLGATSEGGDAHVTATGAHVITRVSGGCYVWRMSDGSFATHTDIPDNDSDCADINDFVPIPGYRILANSQGLCFGTPTSSSNSCTYQNSFSGGLIWGMAHDYFGSAFEKSASASVYAGKGRPLGAALTDPLTPTVSGSAVTTKHPKRLLESVALEGEFRGVTPSGAWAAGHMFNATLGVDRPFFFEVSGSTGIPLLTFDSSRPGYVNAITDAAGGSFIAVGEADHLRGGSEVVTRDAIRWNGITDTPDWLTSLDDANTSCVTRATSINSDGSYVGGSSCGEAVVWDRGEYVGPMSLMRFVAASNPVPAGWVLTEVTDVALNDDVFVGKGTLNGVPRNWAIDMQGTPVPEPPMTALAGAGLLAIVAVQKRRAALAALVALGVLVAPWAASAQEAEEIVALEAMEAGRACLEGPALTDEEREACVRSALEAAQDELAGEQ